MNTTFNPEDPVTKQDRPEHPNTAYRPFKNTYRYSPSQPAKHRGTTNLQRGNTNMTTRVQKRNGKTKKLSQTKTQENKKTSRTSLQAYQQKKQDGTLTSDREKVKELVQKLGPISSKELQMWMNKPKHTFSGRLTELQDQGLIQVTGVEDGHKKYEVKQ